MPYLEPIPNPKPNPIPTIPDIEITSDYKNEIKNELKKLIEVCGLNNLTCIASGRADYWKRIKKIGKHSDNPSITFEIFNG